MSLYPPLGHSRLVLHARAARAARAPDTCRGLVARASRRPCVRRDARQQCARPPPQAFRPHRARARVALGHSPASTEAGGDDGLTLARCLKRHPRSSMHPLLASSLATPPTPVLAVRPNRHGSGPLLSAIDCARPLTHPRFACSSSLSPRLLPPAPLACPSAPRALFFTCASSLTRSLPQADMHVNIDYMAPNGAPDNDRKMKEASWLTGQVRERPAPFVLT